MRHIATIFHNNPIFLFHALVNWHQRHWLLPVIILFVLGNAILWADTSDGTLRKIRAVYPGEWNVSNEAGLTYSTQLNQFFLMSHSQPQLGISDGAIVTAIAPFEDLVGIVPLNVAIDDTNNLVFDDRHDRLFFLNSSAAELTQIKVNNDGLLNPATLVSFDISSFGLESAHGMDIDADGESLFILDSSALQIIQVKLEANFEPAKAEISVIDLLELEGRNLDSFAVNHENNHFYIIDNMRMEVHELTLTGEHLVSYTSSDVDLIQPHSMVFAPSTDLTDAPNIMHLFISDSKGTDSDAETMPIGKGEVIEMALIKGDQLDADRIDRSPGNRVPLGLVKTTDFSHFSTPSSDPSGIAFISSMGQLLVGDSEISEIPMLFTGDNLFQVSISGRLMRSGTTTSYTVEPTGIAYNPKNKHIFISDDNSGEVFEVDPGADGNYGTGDDRMVGSFATRHFPSPPSRDPEGLTYDADSGNLFIVDGSNHEIYRVDPGVNQIFDGVSGNGGDDRVTHFDTAVLGIFDPEGIHYSASTGNLIVTGNNPTEFYEITTTGSLVRTFDFSAANPIKPAGITMAPGSKNSDELNFYIVDRAVDNNIDPDENDGKMYELTLDTNRIANAAPIVEILPDQTIGLEESISLTASVTDDGLPTPPGTVTTTWKKTSGSGTVTFSNANALTTSATFSREGTYILRFLADDGDLISFDEVTIYVLGGANTRVFSSSDDAEERNLANLSVGSRDLDLGEDDRIVGIRFSNLDVPRGAAIADAYIQFQTDETQGQPVKLTIHGEAVDYAHAFSNKQGKIASRPRTSASISWSPPPWTKMKEASLDQRTPNLRLVIQEIVNRPGWVKGNPLAIIISGFGGKRTAGAFDGNPLGAPLMHVEFGRTNQNQFPKVVIKSPKNKVGFTEDDTIEFVGTANDPEDGDITAALLWSSNSDDILGNGGSFKSSDLSVGTHTITATAIDNDGHQGSSEVTFSVTKSSGKLNTNVRVNGDADDAEESSSGSVTGGSSDLELVFNSRENAEQTVGIRFNDLNLPHGAVIIDAYIQFKVDEIGSIPTSLKIQGEAADNAEPFNNSKDNITSRPMTSASASWSVPPWTSTGDAGPDQRTPGLACVIQEVVNRPGWNNGNSLAVIISGRGKRTAAAYNGDKAGAPLLHVEYSISN